MKSPVFALLIWLFVWTMPVFSQTTDVPETADHTVVEDPYQQKSPAVAFWRSALFPGLGQRYVEQKTKSYILAGTEVLLLSACLYEYERTDHYSDLLEQSTPADQAAIYDHYSQHYQRRNTLLWINGIFWFLNAADAYVQAHLYNFDTPLNFDVSFSQQNQDLSVICYVNLPIPGSSDNHK